jgi:hypothetical protein
MPLMKYFGFVGSALLLLLLGLDWYLPPPAAEAIRTVDTPVIRISSIEKSPDRVDIDTSLPTIVPATPESEFAERWAEVAFIEVKTVARPTNITVNDNAPTPWSLAKREMSKKVVARRIPSSAKDNSSINLRKQSTAAATRISLLDVIRERFGHGFFKLN